MIHNDNDGRRRIIARHVEPHTDSAWCEWRGHRLPNHPDLATYVYTPEGDLLGMLCDRCGALAFPNPKPEDIERHGRLVAGATMVVVGVLLGAAVILSVVRG